MVAVMLQNQIRALLLYCEYNRRMWWNVCAKWK